jgi:hypothetical protein
MPPFIGPMMTGALMCRNSEHLGETGIGWRMSSMRCLRARLGLRAPGATSDSVEAGDISHAQV